VPEIDNDLTTESVRCPHITCLSCNPLHKVPELKEAGLVILEMAPDHPHYEADLESANGMPMGYEERSRQRSQPKS
jgi:hypothetical protein